MADPIPHVLFLCTGNAARSVMAGAMLSAVRDDVKVTTAGTLVIDGQPMSRRTREALAGIGLEVPGHRSHQVDAADLDAADLVVAMAGEHVAYVRRRHPEAAGRTATIKRLCHRLEPGDAALGERVAHLRLDQEKVESWEDVEDPAGGDSDDFRNCADELSGLVEDLARRLG